ncbi:coiled-coil domain-containing protein 40 isoform X1 [Acanthopagrus latus]|uniref:coiled-coil domain-containing protein 40 isoform X1 n=2 Tax=Acanthopagrus latus TaxID=8177 RepID=UPI00187C6C6D|nr:coiled-coil domain-containing protein 40 isoform X1 [Acanthopagrus latus]
MQNAGGAEGEQPSEEESYGELQDGGYEGAQDSGESVPPAQEGGSQDQSGTEDGDPTPQLNLDYSEQENVSQLPLIPHLSNLDAPDDMEYQELLPEGEEKEELTVLDPEHPLVKRHQAALTIQLKRRLERVNLALKEKRALEKADASHIQEIELENSRLHKRLARLRAKLEDRQLSKEQAEAKHRQAQDQLQQMKSQFTSMTSQDSKVKAEVSQLQGELDNLNQHLVFTQGLSEDLRSNVKAMQNARHKVGAEKTQAEEQKLKQDLYVERLTKDLERLMQQIAMYDTQTSAQAKETQAAKEALFEAEMEMESLVMARKQLVQQWSSSLMGIGRRDEAFSAMQEALRTVEHQLILLDKEIESYKKSTTEEQEQNETLTMQLKGSQMDCATYKKLISEKQAQQEALQAHFSTCLRTLKETERTLTRLSTETSTHQAEVNNQRRQLEKESAGRLELEDKIMTYMQQKLTHNRAAKYSQKLTSKTATLKKEKISQLWQLENDIAAMTLESSEVSQRLDSLAITQEALDEEVANYNKLLASNQAKISSFITLIKQKQSTITNYNKQIYQITASTGHEDLSPLQIKAQELMDQIAQLAVIIKSDQRLWMKRLETQVGLTHELEANRKNMLKLQTEYTTMQQKKMLLESQIEAEHREKTDLEKSVKMLKGDRVKLNTLLSKKGQLSMALEQENALMETDFLRRLKEAERESIEMQMKNEKKQKDKEMYLNCLVEAEKQIMLWQKKTELIKETRSVVDSEVKGDIQAMKAEIHRMEVRLSRIMKQSEKLQRESEATVARRETLVLRREALLFGSQKKVTKGGPNLKLQGLKRKIKNTNTHVVEWEQKIRELQESKVSLSDRLAQQKQHLIELCGTSCNLDPDIENLQDTKHRKFNHLVTLQSRSKKLQEVRQGSYQALSTSQSISAALQRQMERVHATSTILHRVGEEFPQHQGTLRRVSQALAAHTQALEQEIPQE